MKRTLTGQIFSDSEAKELGPATDIADEPFKEVFKMAAIILLNLQTQLP
jgi:hypothetical protein